MRKRLKRTKGICSCTSPRCTDRSSFSWYEQDMWTYIARFLDGRSLVMLGAVSKWFNSVIMQDCVWKFACLRDLQVPDPGHVAFSWAKLYASAVDGSHSYMFRQQEKHIDWMRIGAFSFESEVAFLSERLSAPVKIPKQKIVDDMLQSCGTCLLRKVKTGIWIADLQLVRCPVCDQEKCEGTMQMLDARHIELFLSQGYQDGSWDYELVGSHEIKKRVPGAYGSIFDFRYLTSKTAAGGCKSFSELSEVGLLPLLEKMLNNLILFANKLAGVFNYKSWIGRANDFQPKAIITLHAVAVNTNLQENQGILIKYHTMRAGAEGEIVSIRISQQLL
ncbi:F-box protein, putative [Theobroma cacao]|uniref:F-box protein, putative n=1 Tax=Theobroma cacao TaxID=3641 RepID=A0A061DUJ3_THECC|nr:F-box protein, putative [Theobroma cacao]